MQNYRADSIWEISYGARERRDCLIPLPGRELQKPGQFFRQEKEMASALQGK